MIDFIYHVSLKDDFLAFVNSNLYSPPSLKEEGFIHCSLGGKIGTIVLNKYFSSVKTEIVILKIETSKVVSMVKFEDPSPLPLPGDKTYPSGTKFPHIYGPLNLDAIVSYGAIKKSGNGYKWPDEFKDAEAILQKAPSRA
jgi:uncharacterized protein (DUF952 family)